MPDQQDQPYWGEAYTALIHEWDGDIRAVVLYNEFTGVSCTWHTASAPGKQWITRPFLVEAFGYPFLELGVLRLTAKVAENNARIIRLIEHLGFVHEGRHPDGVSLGVALLSYGMLRKHCRYLEPPYYEQTKSPDPARSHGDDLSPILSQHNGGIAERPAQSGQSGNALG